MSLPERTAPDAPGPVTGPEGEAEGVEPAVTLAILVKRFPRLSETFILNEILELRRRGIPVRVMAFMAPGEPWAHPEAEALQPEVIYLRDRPWPRLLSRLLRTAAAHPTGTLRALRWTVARRSKAAWRMLGEGLLLVDACRGLGPTHVHAHFAHGPAAASYLAHLVAGTPYSFTAHAKDLYTTRADSVAQRAGAATFVATCTEANVRYLVDTVGIDRSRVRLGRHGVDIGRFGGIRRRPVDGRVLSIGRLVPKKGFDVLVRACAELAGRGQTFDCRIVGDGPVRADLDELIERLGLTGCVRIEPARPQTGLLDAYAEASVFVLAPTVQPDGDRDGLPNVIQEAMAAGVPVVSTTISGIPEVVQDGLTGLLVPPGDPRALADALEVLLVEPDTRLRLSHAARAYARRHCGLGECIEPLEAALRGALFDVAAATRTGRARLGRR